MIIGFTGTRRGMTKAQNYAFSELVWKLKPVHFHHGACVGSDTEAAMLVERQGAASSIIAHPGRSATGVDNALLSKAALDASNVELPTNTHFARNRDIVDASDVLIATPWQIERPAKGTGGGTWYTIEYAERLGKRTYIIWPDGKVNA